MLLRNTAEKYNFTRAAMLLAVNFYCFYWNVFWKIQQRNANEKYTSPAVAMLLAVNFYCFHQPRCSSCTLSHCWSLCWICIALHCRVLPCIALYTSLNYAAAAAHKCILFGGTPMMHWREKNAFPPLHEERCNESIRMKVIKAEEATTTHWLQQIAKRCGSSERICESLERTMYIFLMR